MIDVTQRQIDAAIAAGLTEQQVTALVIARHSWQLCGQLDPITVTEELCEALRHPAADAWDAIFARRARDELSVPTPSVTP